MSEKYNNIFYKNGKGIQSRFREKWVRENAPELAEVIENSHFYMNNLYDFITILHIFLNGNIDDTPICPICNKSHYKWKKQKKEWSKYCSMKCCQNDPEVKTKMLEGQKGVDWDSVIKHRETTMLETYGVAAYSQLESAKEALSIRSSEYWKDKEHIESAKIIRAATNLENYGVEHLSMDKEYHTKRVLKAVDTKQNKSEEEKKTIVEKYRKSRLGDYKYSYLSNKEWLANTYNTGKRLAEIGNMVDVHPCAVQFSLEQYRIQIDWKREQTNRSLLEMEFYDYILSLAPDAIHTYKFGNTQHNVDVFVPSKNISFEFNGVYWHSEAKKEKDFHKNKMKMVNGFGLRLVQIWEDDWINRKNVVRNFLSNLLCRDIEKIGARHTTVIELTPNEFEGFMERNHLQGYTSSGVKLGLIKDGSILSAIGFTEIENHTGIYNLTRFANTKVIGAFQKLLNHFEKKYKPILLKTFGNLEIVDRNNNIYTKNGFVEDKIINEDYMYYNPISKTREHKFNWRKNKFKLLGIDITNKDERILAIEYGLLRCYDSGKIRYLKYY